MRRDLRSAGARPRWASDELLAFVFVVIVSVGIGIADDMTGDFVFDAKNYWHLFSISEGQAKFADQLRGYLPLTFYGGLHAFTDATGVVPRHLLIVVNSLQFGLIGAVLVPRLGMVVAPAATWGLVRRSLAGLLLAVFWSGYLVEPLTDFPALTTALVAVLLASSGKGYPALIGAGLAAAVTLNFRPAYLLFVVGVLLLAAIVRPEARRPGRATSAAAVLLGLIAISLPQSLLHHSKFGIWSPVPGATVDLQDLQLTAGLRLQLYGTNLDPDVVGPVLNYRDPSGESLIRPSDLTDGSIDGLAGYTKIFLREPVGVTTNIVRHVINAMDQRYGSPYPFALDVGQRFPFRLVGFLLVFGAAARFLWPRARRAMGPVRLWAPAVLLLSVVTTLPSATEQRFFLPVFAVVLSLVLIPGWRAALRGADGVGRPRTVEIAVLVVALLAYGAFVGNIARQADRQLEIGRQLIYELPYR